MPFERGRVFSGEFRIERELSRGGMGEVYVALQLSTGRERALKVMRPEIVEEPNLRKRFEQEATVGANIKSEHIVEVIAAGIDDATRTPWLAMELLEGETLGEMIDRKGGLTFEEAREPLRQLAHALTAAHAAGVIHRDLKPDNVFVARSRRASEIATLKVLDFGIAKVVAEVRAAATAPIGTLLWMAPEQAEADGAIGPSTDGWSFGLLAFYMLVGRTFWDEKSSVPSMLKKLTLEPIPSASTRAREVERFARLPHGFDAWFAKMVARAPEDRYASIAEASDDLQRLLSTSLVSSAPTEHAPLVTRPTTPTMPESKPRPAPMPMPRTTRARPLVAAVAIGAIAVAAVFAVRSQPRDVPTIASAAPSSAASATHGCASNVACTAALGRSAICKRSSGACVALASDDCSVSAEPADLESDDTIWVGSMFPKTGRDADEYGIVNHHAVELARRDFAQVMVGLPGDRARPLGVISCDDAIDPRRAARHLVHDVGVPAVIGFRSSVEAIELANAELVPSGTLAIAAINANPLVTTVPQPLTGPRLIWRTTYTTVDAASAIARFVETVIEPSLRATTKRATRVALVRPKQAAGAAFSDAMFAKLAFNGKHAIDNGDDYRELTYDADAADGGSELAAMTNALLAFRPSVVVYAAGRAIVRGVFAPVDARWPASAGARPTYVSIGALTDDVFDLIHRGAVDRHRFFGFSPIAETPANAHLVVHYEELFPEKITRSNSPNSTYDAFYFIAFASYALRRDEAVSGTSLAGAFSRLVPPGKPVEVGIGGILDAYQTLQRGDAIDVTGATGKLDFDRATGNAAFDYSILCVGIDAAGHPVDGVPSGLTFVVATQKLEGEMRCP